MIIPGCTIHQQTDYGAGGSEYRTIRLDDWYSNCCEECGRDVDCHYWVRRNYECYLKTDQGAAYRSDDSTWGLQSGPSPTYKGALLKALRQASSYDGMELHGIPKII